MNQSTSTSNAHQFGNSVFRFATYRLKTRRDQWFRPTIFVLCCVFLLLASGQRWWGYYLTATLLALAWPISGALHFAYLAQSELALLCAPSSKRIALIQYLVLSILCIALGCAPLLIAPVANPYRLFVIVLAAAIAYSQLERSIILAPKVACADEQKSAAQLANLGCLMMVPALWLFDAPTIFLCASALLPLLSLLPYIAPNAGLSRLLRRPLKTYSWLRLPPPIGEINRLLNIRPVVNSPVLSIGLTATALLLYISYGRAPRQNAMHSGFELYLIVMLGSGHLLKFVRGWLKTIPRNALHVLPIIGGDRRLAAHVWSQLLFFISAFFLSAFLPRFIFWGLHPELFIQSALSIVQWVETLAVVLVGTLQLVWTHAYTLRSTLSANPDKIFWFKFVNVLSMAISAAAMSIVVDFAKSGGTIPLYVTAPIVAVCGYLNYRERKLWLRDPAALWSANSTKENL
jgi:hypothetical protein